MIETYRDGGKVKQRVIANLGECATVAEAKAVWPRYISRLAADLASWECCLREGLEREAKCPGCRYRMPLGYWRQDGKRIIEREIARCRRRLANEETNLRRIMEIGEADVCTSSPERSSLRA
ncbi:hypothetical protein [Variovorax sp. Sphag1AA]|uniref:hypothetical protein n=1 Tax=Variovorax sp. Sphag1AA TaxID=2587027 RepID=UPI0016104F3F|nr:hypothetical protein [Variovorax sp. Sphag1AA]MBB3175895.1 hypothetical protein [Variovorax sp. Sphag1AA]